MPQLQILLIIFSICILGGCKKDPNRPNPPELGLIKLCYVDAPEDKSRTDCVCGMTSGTPFDSPLNLTHQKVKNVVDQSMQVERLPIQKCDKGVLIPADYYFIFHTWLKDLLAWINNYCSNLL